MQCLKMQFTNTSEIRVLLSIHKKKTFVSGGVQWIVFIAISLETLS